LESLAYLLRAFLKRLGRPLDLLPHASIRSPVVTTWASISCRHRDGSFQGELHVEQARRWRGLTQFRGMQGPCRRRFLRAGNLTAHRSVVAYAAENSENIRRESPNYPWKPCGLLARGLPVLTGHRGMDRPGCGAVLPTTLEFSPPVLGNIP
jgi:hypothetical protein